MKPPCLISVVLCTYNGHRFLAQQLDSIQAQTRLPDEVIVCDDGSTDGTLEALMSFAARTPFPVRIYRNERQLGSTRNFDLGISLAQGEWIVLCDQDDVWESTKLERFSEVMRDETIGGIFTDATLIDEDDKSMSQSLWSRAGFSPARRVAFQRDPVGVLLRQDVATGATMMFRARLRTFYEAIPTAWVHDGWLAWMLVLHALEAGRLMPLEDRLTRYRVHAWQQTGSSAVALGLPSDSVRTRLAKAGVTGHEHHVQLAARLRLVLENWLSRGGAPDAEVAQRLRGTIHLLERRSLLPSARWRRFLAMFRLIPGYMRYANGWRSAGRDLLA